MSQNAELRFRFMVYGVKHDFAKTIVQISVYSSHHYLGHPYTDNDSPHEALDSTSLSNQDF